MRPASINHFDNYNKFQNKTYWRILCTTARTQPIICNSTPDMIKDHFLPIAEKLRENAEVVEAMEKRLAQEKRVSMEGSEDYEQFVQEVCPKSKLSRDP